MRTRGPVAPRFWSKVQKANGCWLWQGAINEKGYGIFNLGGEKERAHRVSFLLTKGAIAGTCILHKCDNPRCVNPDHLFSGTKTDNCADKVAKGRQFHRRNATHCIRGHEYTPANTYHFKNGRRRCVACHAASRNRTLNPIPRHLRWKQPNQLP